MTQELRIGVVGCGYWGSKHVRVLSSISDVDVALIDQDAERRNKLTESYTVFATVARLEDVADSLDAVIIATPPTTHYPVAKAALEAGLHVLVEKPMTTDIDDAVHLNRLAEEQNRCLMVGHTFEYNPAVWSLADTIRDPEFGRVRYINSARLNLGLYQQDTDVLWDLAPHDISIINRILDSRPTSVSAWGLKLMGDKSDVAYLSLRYGDIDVNASIHVSWLDPLKVRKTTVVGENCMAVYDDVSADERLRVFDKGVDKGTRENSPSHPLHYRNGNIVSPYIDFQEPLMLELSAFVRSIRTGERPVADGRSGLDVVSTLCAADASQRLGGSWVEVPHPTLNSVVTNDESSSLRLVEVAK